jgi:hypothetical protein
MAILLTEVRDILSNQIGRTFASGTPFTENKADVAIKTVLHHTNYVAKVVRSKGAENTVADTATVDLTNTSTTFEARRLMSMRIGLASGTALYDTFSLKSLNYVQRLLSTDTSTSQPKYLAFETDSSALLYPIPDAAYTITFIWNEPETDFALGASGAGVTFKMPEDVIYPSIAWGGAALFQYVDFATRVGSRGWVQYEKWLEDLKGEYTDQGEDFVEPDTTW